MSRPIPNFLEKSLIQLPFKAVRNLKRKTKRLAPDRKRQADSRMQRPNRQFGRSGNEVETSRSARASPSHRAGAARTGGTGPARPSRSPAPLSDFAPNRQTTPFPSAPRQMFKPDRLRRLDSSETRANGLRLSLARTSQSRAVHPAL